MSSQSSRSSVSKRILMRRCLRDCAHNKSTFFTARRRFSVVCLLPPRFTGDGVAFLERSPSFGCAHRSGAGVGCLAVGNSSASEAQVRQPSHLGRIDGGCDVKIRFRCEADSILRTAFERLLGLVPCAEAQTSKCSLSAAGAVGRVWQ